MGSRAGAGSAWPGVGDQREGGRRGLAALVLAGSEQRGSEGHTRAGRGVQSPGAGAARAAMGRGVSPGGAVRTRAPGCARQAAGTPEGHRTPEGAWGPRGEPRDRAPGGERDPEERRGDRPTPAAGARGSGPVGPARALDPRTHRSPHVPAAAPLPLRFRLLLRAGSRRPAQQPLRGKHTAQARPGGRRGLKPRPDVPASAVAQRPLPAPSAALGLRLEARGRAPQAAPEGAPRPPRRPAVSHPVPPSRRGRDLGPAASTLLGPPQNQAVAPK